MDSKVIIEAAFCIVTIVVGCIFMTNPKWANFKRNKLYKFYLTDFKGGLYEYSLWAFNNREAQTKLITFFFIENGVATVMKEHHTSSIPILTKENIAISDIFTTLSKDQAFGRIITGIGTERDKAWFKELLSKLNIQLDENNYGSVTRHNTPTL